MIHVPTVLVLGAGASSAYGFPLGNGLRDRITQINPEKYAHALESIGISSAEFLEFRDTFQHSAYRSIDWFLERNSRFMKTGKAAIALALIPLEVHDRLFPPHAKDEHWYEILYNAMCDSDGVLLPSNLVVVTLNYDRSLEHYLLTVLTKRLGNVASAADVLARLPIVHLHGLLGEYVTASNRRGRVYDNQVTASTLRLAMDGIIVVSEAGDSSSTYVEAAQHLRAADRIIFLGFGFHDATLRRLVVFNEPWTKEKNASTIVTGTSRKLPGPAWDRVRKGLLRPFWTGRRQIGTVTHLLTEVLELDSPRGTNPR